MGAVCVFSEPVMVMVASAAAVAGAKRGTANGRRIAAQRRNQRSVVAANLARRRQLAERIITIYDKDKSGSLSREELPDLLMDHSQQIYGALMVPSGDDVQFLLKVCDRGGETADGAI